MPIYRKPLTLQFINISHSKSIVDWTRILTIDNAYNQFSCDFSLCSSEQKPISLQVQVHIHNWNLSNSSAKIFMLHCFCYNHISRCMWDNFLLPLCNAMMQWEIWLPYLNLVMICSILLYLFVGRCSSIVYTWGIKSWAQKKSTFKLLRVSYISTINRENFITKSIVAWWEVK